MKFLVNKRFALSAIALASVFAASTFAVAEEAPAKPAKTEKGARGPMGGVLKDLNLTDAQKAQIKEITDAQKTKREALKNDTTLAPKDKRKQQKALREDAEAQIRAILTPEQQVKFDAALAEQKAERKNKDKPAA